MPSKLRATVANNIQREQIRLTEHSGNTGGRSFANRNDFDGVIDDLMSDNGSYYVLGYYPDPFVADGKFHTLNVKVKRPGVKVRARAGYVASSAVDAAADSMNPVSVAIGSGTSVADVSMRATATPVGPGATTGVATAVTVEMTYPPIANAVRSVDDDVQMLVAALSPEGKIIATSEHAIHFTGTRFGRTTRSRSSSTTWSNCRRSTWRSASASPVARSARREPCSCSWTSPN